MSKVIHHDLFRVKADAIALINAFRSTIMFLLSIYKLLEAQEDSNAKKILENLKDLIPIPKAVNKKQYKENIKQFIANCIKEDDKSGAHSRVFQREGSRIFINLIKAVGGLDTFLELYLNAREDKENHSRVINAEKIENINAKYIILLDLDRDYTDEVWRSLDSFEAFSKGEISSEYWVEGLDFDIEKSFIDFYSRSVKAAYSMNLNSLAIPVYEPPLVSGPIILPFQICQNAVDEEDGFLDSDMRIYLTLYNEYLTHEVGWKFDVAYYINSDYIKENEVNQTFETGEKYVPVHLPAIDKNGKSTKTFPELLCFYIEKSKKKPSDIYNKIFLDRRAFSLYKNGKEKPPKRKIIELAIALCLPIGDAESLLESAGYAFLQSDTAERILKQNIEFSCYDIEKINKELYSQGVEKLIGCIE